MVFTSRKVLLGSLLVGLKTERVAFPWRDSNTNDFGEFVCDIDLFNQVVLPVELDDVVVCREAKQIRELVSVTTGLR